MAVVRLPREVIDDYLMSRSVMDAPRNAFQKLTDVLFGRTFPEQATNAFTSLSPLRIGVLPGRERIASDIIKRGLKEPWFHGSRAIPGILDEGALGPGRFDPSRIGSAYGLRLGEPAGVSLTRSPEVARTFGDVLRVGVDIPPSSVGQFVDPEIQRILRAGFGKASQIPSLPPGPMTVSEFLSKTGNMPQMVNKETVASFNQVMSDYLRNQGVEGIAYNPRRWGEYELRVLDPSKAVPLGRLDMPPGYSSAGPSPIQRYLLGRPPGGGGKIGQLNELYRNAPEFPTRLHQVLGVAGVGGD